MVEWYIIEYYTMYKPTGNTALLGTGIYEIYKTVQVNQPSIFGIKTFDQYWSIRTTGRFNGTVNVNAHFQAWENIGLTMGKLSEVALNIEGWQSSGNANVLTNVLSIE